MTRLQARSLDDDDDDVDRLVDVVAAAQLLPDVVAAITQLPAGERDALILHAWEHPSYDDIARAPSTSPSARCARG